MSDIKKQPGFCYEIFKNQAAWSTRSTIGYNPCSFYKGFSNTDVTPEQAWNSPERHKIIEQVKNGKTIPGCIACYKLEKNGQTSRRLQSKELYENFLKEDSIDAISSPLAIDYSVGNLCNLKCTICRPNHSSSWISDWAKLYPNEKMDHYFYRKNQYVSIEDTDYLKNIRVLHFHGGGDPLLSSDHVRLLKNVESVKGLQDVRVYYNINATNHVTQEVLDLWSKCQLVELYFSIDDVGERFEYQRTGARWNHTLETMNWFRDNMPINHMFNINCTWGYLNFYYLDELYNWHKENFSTNRLGDPVNLIFQKCHHEYGLHHVSSNAKQILENKFKDIPDLMLLLSTLEISNKPHVKFWDSIERLDTIRNRDFKKLCPNWSKLL